MVYLQFAVKDDIWIQKWPYISESSWIDLCAQKFPGQYLKTKQAIAVGFFNNHILFNTLRKLKSKENILKNNDLKK